MEFIFVFKVKGGFAPLRLRASYFWLALEKVCFAHGWAIFSFCRSKKLTQSERSAAKPTLICL